jgi:membrane associated rhomboid family serine protease
MRFRHLAITAALAVTVAFPALAGGDADWAKPATDGITTLTNTIVTVAGALIGLSIVCFGIWSAATQRIEWAKLWIFFLAGMLVTAGPPMIIWWIELMQKK